MVSPSRSVTIAFFQSGVRPATYPRRRVLPPTFNVLTFVTLTLNSYSTAWRISILLASTGTRKWYALRSAVSSVPFSESSGSRMIW